MRFLGILAALAIFAVGSADAAQDGLIRVNTRLVEVNVVVRDKDGPVSGLASQDFTILDNGKPQRVEVFSVSDARTQKPQRNPLPAGVVSNRLDSGGEIPITATVILFDRLNTELRYQDHAIRQLIEYLRSIRKEDRISLYILDSDLHVAQDFTGDPDRLVRAASKLQAENVSGSDTRTAQELIASLAVGDTSISPEFANAISAGYTANRAAITAKALEAIARHLGGLPGRKNVIWMSSGFPIAPQLIANEIGQNVLMGKEIQVDFISQVDRAGRALNDANIAIYPVDTRGLPAPEPSRTVGRRGQVFDPLPPPDVAMRLANATGGQSFYFTNGIATAVRTAVSDGELSYTLGFYLPESNMDDKVHKLTVKVDRKRVEVHHRSSYVATGEHLLAEKQRTAVMADLVGSPLNATQLEIFARAEQDETHPGTYRVMIVINAVDIRMDQQGDRRTGTLELAMRLDSSKSKSANIEPIPLNLSEDQFRIALKSGLVLYESITAGARDRLRIVIQDHATGLAGSLWLPLEAR